MKKLLLASALCFIITCSYSQNFKTETLAEQTLYYLCSGTKSQVNSNCSSRRTIKINVKPNTKKIIYSFTTTPAGNGTKVLNLGIKVAAAVSTGGLAAVAASSIEIPSGTNSADIFVIPSNYEQAFLNKQDQNWGYDRDISLENVSQGTKTIENPNVKSFCLGLKNPSSLNGVNVIIEVVAIIEEEETLNGWTKQQKEYLYKNLKNQSAFKAQFTNISEENTNEVIACSIGKLTEKYTPTNLKAYAEFELNSMMSKTISACKKELNLLDNTSQQQVTKQTQKDNSQETENSQTVNPNNRPKPLSIEQRKIMKEKAEADLISAFKLANINDEEQASIREFMKDAATQSKQTALNSELTSDEKRESMKKINDEKNEKIKQLIGEVRYKNFMQIRKTQKEAAMAAKKVENE